MSDVQPTNFDPEDMTDLYTLYKSDPEFVKVLKQNANNTFLKNNAGSGEGADITASQITDSTAVGRSVLTAETAAAARTAIGAGTGNSNLALGTTSTTAKRGDYAPAWTEVTGKPTTFMPPAATEAAIGGVKMAATQADSTATDIETLVSDFNSLLAKLKAAGIMA